MGNLVPRYPGRVIYFSDRLYGDGAKASDELGIADKSVDICFAVPKSRISGLTGPSPVAAVMIHGKVLRNAGGMEYQTRWPVSVDTAVVLEMRVP